MDTTDTVAAILVATFTLQFQFGDVFGVEQGDPSFSHLTTSFLRFGAPNWLLLNLRRRSGATGRS